MEVLDYGNPYNQVNRTVRNVYKIFLEKFNKKYFVHGIVYFNYKDDAANYLFFNGSSPTNPITGINQKENLLHYFEDKFKTVNKTISLAEIADIVEAIKKDVIL